MDREFIFITGEGIDGSGKTTALGKLKRYYEEKGYTVIIGREPGTTEASEKIRNILLHDDIDSKAKLLLVLASRADTVSKILAEYVNRKVIVLYDRFIDSTTVYQGYAEGIDLYLINKLNNFVAGDYTPDLTLWFDVDLNTAYKRIHNDDIRVLSNFDIKDKLYFTSLINGYAELYEKNSRFERIDANNTPDDVLYDCIHIIDKLIKKRGW